MCHIQVATHHHGFLGVERQQILAKGIVPRHAVVESAQAILRVGGVHGDKVELRHFEGDDTAFVVVLLNAKAISHAQWLVTRKNGCARIAFLFGRIPIRLITLKRHVELMGLHLCLLQTKKSASSAAKLSLKPLPSQARRPFTFHDMNFIDLCLLVLIRWRISWLTR